MSKRPQPSTAAERQAVLVLEAAYEVAANIEARRTTLRNCTVADAVRRRARDGLIEAAERLVNLLFLASQRISADVSRDIAQMVTHGMNDLRTRLLATGTGLVVDRAEKVKSKALSVVDGGEACPIGLSPRLAAILGGVDATVDALGGFKVLPDHDRKKVTEARLAVNRLAEFEQEMGILTEL